MCFEMAIIKGQSDIDPGCAQDCKSFSLKKKNEKNNQVQKYIISVTELHSL